MTIEFNEDGAQDEWHAQECAVQAERRNAGPSKDPRVVQYRLIARVLRRPALDPLPSSLIADSMARIEAARSADERWENWLHSVLLLLLCMAGVVALATVKPLPNLLAWAATFRSDVSGWMLTILLCFGITAFVEHRVMRGTRGGGLGW